MPAKKKVGSVHTAKNGAKYKIMPNGRARFISGPTKGRGAKKKKAGSVRVAGSITSELGRRARNMVKRSGAGSAVRAANYALGGSVRVAGGVRRKRKH